MKRRRLVAVWAVNAVLAVALGALVAAAERASVGPAPVRAAAPVVVTATPAASLRPAPVASPRARPRVPAGRSLRATLRRAYVTGAIERRTYRSWARTERGARRWLRRLSGLRHAELASVVSVVDRLASSGQLTVSRMPLAFLTLRRNLQVWSQRRLPNPGERMTFGGDPAVFQYYVGRGVQHHPLASAGRINALVQPCLREVRTKVYGTHCHIGLLRRSLDSLARLSSVRGGFVAFEYLFSFGQGAPPWISAMTQGTAAEAFARGARVFKSARYRRVALGALGAFEAAPPLGVRVGDEYVMYSFAPSLHIINGFLQSLIGLHDVGVLTGSPEAKRLFTRGERVARAAVARYDTGAWSLYSFRGRESPLSYHELVTGFLRGMCDRTGRAEYCTTERHFARYLRRPPSLVLWVADRGLARRRVGAGFSIDKGSSVTLVIRGRGLHFRRTFPAARGRHDISFTPGRSGRFLVALRATGPEGRTAARHLYVRVKRRTANSTGRSKSRRTTRSTRHPAR